MVGLQDIHICSADQTYGAGRSMELQNVDYDIITAAELAYAHYVVIVFFFSSRRRHTRCSRDWSSDVCSSDLLEATRPREQPLAQLRDPRQQVVLHDVERRKRGGAAYGVAAERRAVRAGTPRHDRLIRDDRPDRHAAAQPLSREQDVGLDRLVLAGEHLPGTPHPALHLVAHEQDAVPIAQLPQRRQITRRGHHVTPLPLNRLHEDRCDARGVDLFREQLVFDGRYAAHRTPRLAATVVAAGALAVWDVVHLRQERRESCAVDRLARREAQAAVRAAVERPQEGDHRRAPRRDTLQLDRAFDGLGPGVRQEHALLARSRRQLGEPLTQCREALEVEVTAADVEELRRRVLNRSDDCGVAVAGGRDRDAGHEVEVAVPVHVLDHGPLAARDHQRILLGVRGGRPEVLARDDLPRLRSGGRDDDARIVPHTSITVRLCSVISSASANRRTISSISCSVTMNGGATMTRSPFVPSACPTLGHTTSPVCCAASVNDSAKRAVRGSGARVALSSTNSIPASSPRPRTSPT